MVEITPEFIAKARWFLVCATSQGRQQGRTPYYLLMDRFRLDHHETEKVLALLKAEGFRT
ncbi:MULTISPECIES: hypothetical protein [unclassified Mesorhizobium]|uniref:hypothetical protein n=1 Tax=unclassified Mesorhizobium TaxID=325217 RepID=UPI001093D0B0|nr:MULTISPECIES: hypothetical protein [unclassified Mesorhizobium]TGS46016.1 hypothetical protein EN825_10345 [Mesorhizobium sp. M8A.F.Ca.ET.182.01.1.1]TGS81471.1 hypothetical protein EN824_10560 [Mesorhizobium sp. M8A.F.Ca.ET.181.01.1.1]